MLYRGEPKPLHDLSLYSKHVSDSKVISNQADTKTLVRAINSVF